MVVADQGSWQSGTTSRPSGVRQGLCTSTLNSQLDSYTKMFSDWCQNEFSCPCLVVSYSTVWSTPIGLSYSVAVNSLEQLLNLGSLCRLM